MVNPVERAMWGISGVDHVYSTAGAGFALVTVRFLVNEPNEASLVKVYERLSTVGAALPPDALPAAVELHSIDDVPFLSLTLWSEGGSSDALRPIAAELGQELSEIAETSKARIIGGQPRAVRVEPDPDRMNAAGVSWTALVGALQSASVRQGAGTVVGDNREVRVEAGTLFRSAEEVARVVVGVRASRPVYVADVAREIGRAHV